MSAWLIEHKTGRGWFGQCNGSGVWTTANAAIQFVRREDAEAVMDLMGLGDATATEHCWVERAGL